MVVTALGICHTPFPNSLCPVYSIAGDLCEVTFFAVSTGDPGFFQALRSTAAVLVFVPRGDQSRASTL